MRTVVRRERRRVESILQNQYSYRPARIGSLGFTVRTIETTCIRVMNGKIRMTTSRKLSGISVQYNAKANMLSQVRKMLSSRAAKCCSEDRVTTVGISSIGGY